MPTPKDHRPRLRQRPACLCVVAVLAGLAAGFAPIPKPKPGKPDPAEKEELRRLQGEWVLVGFNLDGRECGVRRGADVLVVKGGEMTSLREGVARARWVLTLRPSKAPKQMDGAVRGGGLLRSVYRLDGDTLTICGASEEGQGRPADVKARKGAVIEVFKRAQKP